MKEKLRELLNHAHSPYSNVKVSAIVTLKNGKEYKGVNVENSSFGATRCAEQSAIQAAITDGARKNDFESIDIFSNTGKMLFPCGICRQVMSEFFEEDTKVVIHGEKSEINLIFRDIMPNAVTKESF